MTTKLTPEENQTLQQANAEVERCQKELNYAITLKENVVLKLCLTGKVKLGDNVQPDGTIVPLQTVSVAAVVPEMNGEDAAVVKEQK